LFIDASQHFEKVKTQNVLRQEHIDKIVATYRKRIEEEKYSKRVPLNLIAENDYNLNIPRYVDTFEAEEAIDIDAIAKEIKDIDQNMLALDKVLEDYCKQLNILTPF
jgi:type I restriction enzyme M protein